MKKMFAKQGLMSLLASFFLFGLMMFGTNSADAQKLNYNWKQSDQAQTALGTAVRDLHDLLPGLTGNALNNTKAKVYYYKEMIHMIQDGTVVPLAVINGLSIFNTPGSKVDAPTDVVVDNNLRTILQNDATTLLTQ